MDKIHIRIILAVVVLGLSATLAAAQEPTATNPDTIGPYSVTSSMEVGWRGLRVEGNENTYKSDLNYQPGFKFNDSSLLLRTEPGTGTLFDNLLVHVTGWDADPYGYVRVDADKLDWYTFNSTVRRSTYFNALPNIALGQHRDDTRHTFGDFNLILLPTNKPLRLRVGYGFDTRSGDTTSTEDYSRDEFPILAPARMHADTYTFGFDSTLGLWDFSFLQGFRHYKDDAVYYINGFEAGNDGPIVPTYLNTLNRDIPGRGQINFTRFNVHTFLNNMVDITGRITYSHAKTDSTQFETVTGADYTGALVNPDQTSATSTVERPDWIADVGVTVLATPQMRISNTFRYNWFKIDGNENLNEQIISTTPAGTRFTEAN
ncbi:MAG TPA: hypothetical protein PLF26_04975, partial [Blastocatellia bacterium]|nr:hypothetical protein [Blastocatellia bacterium]